MSIIALEPTASSFRSAPATGGSPPALGGVEAKAGASAREREESKGL
jgi:hypothetical protein